MKEHANLLGSNFEKKFEPYDFLKSVSNTFFCPFAREVLVSEQWEARRENEVNSCTQTDDGVDAKQGVDEAFAIAIPQQKPEKCAG